LTDAELVHVALREGLRTLADCSLRVRLGIGACQGASCAAAAASVLAETLGWSAEQTAWELVHFWAERWRAATPALSGAQIPALELHRASDIGARGFARGDRAASGTEDAPRPGAAMEPA
jgi:hypothetical protein